MWQATFTSNKFLPYLPEDAQSNPGKYGFELAHWLSMGLMKRGVVTSYPMQEDWGWYIDYAEDDLELQLGCSNRAS